MGFAWREAGYMDWSKDDTDSIDEKHDKDPFHVGELWVSRYVDSIAQKWARYGQFDGAQKNAFHNHLHASALDRLRSRQFSIWFQEYICSRVPVWVVIEALDTALENLSETHPAFKSLGAALVSLHDFRMEHLSTARWSVDSSPQYRTTAEALQALGLTDSSINASERAAYLAFIEEATREIMDDYKAQMKPQSGFQPPFNFLERRPFDPKAHKMEDRT